uniref:Thioredoxin domain-containing protein n=1 Tax=Chlamydomonas leiostraca TaxID=1034604 RepID=A0A7S0WUD0_9CHLO|eukprot:CAMPEP_0202858434 /NCGR_PEP_ID=MMETSP1391-20130828/972_1 /ASSEMBLY_ACC=CAM_ASM_000867 /TAXON_ID=1034604 /ORGANISM="Chlamydomonas leiostraca, Strain SAG 11-49" /LENGTH=592 /DNA_ID=CAMNT_0049537355 /DNA_START=24 /DNA_END=1802 /DNA_ORIENTATION=+
MAALRLNVSQVPELRLPKWAAQNTKTFLPFSKAYKAPLKERLRYVDPTEDDITDALENADPSQLVVLEIQSASFHQVDGQEREEAELHWQLDKRAKQQEQRAQCLQLHKAVKRASRDCPPCTFLSVQVPDSGPEAAALMGWLEVESLPALQFYKGGELLWDVQGMGPWQGKQRAAGKARRAGGHAQLQPSRLERALGEGILFYAGLGSGGARVASLVQDVTTRAELAAFTGVAEHAGAGPSWCAAPEQPVASTSGAGEAGDMQVLFVGLSSATPCVRIFPAVVALARNLAERTARATSAAEAALQQLGAVPEGTRVPAVKFARALPDEHAGLGGKALLQALRVMDVPSFIFYKAGVEVGRYVGSNPADLFGHVMRFLEAPAPERPAPAAAAPDALQPTAAPVALHAPVPMPAHVAAPAAEPPMPVSQPALAHQQAPPAMHEQQPSPLTVGQLAAASSGATAGPGAGGGEDPVAGVPHLDKLGDLQPAVATALRAVAVLRELVLARAAAQAQAAAAQQAQEGVRSHPLQDGDDVSGGGEDEEGVASLRQLVADQASASIPGDGGGSISARSPSPELVLLSTQAGSSSTQRQSS